MDFYEVFEFVPGNDIKPLAFVADLFQMRAEIKAQNKATGVYNCTEQNIKLTCLTANRLPATATKPVDETVTVFDFVLQVKINVGLKEQPIVDFAMLSLPKTLTNIKIEWPCGNDPIGGKCNDRIGVIETGFH